MLPNILYIISDDLLDFTVHDSLVDEFPNIHALKQDSTVFDNHHVSVPHCGPSRASFLTGKQPHLLRYRAGGQDQNGYYLHLSSDAGSISATDLEADAVAPHETFPQWAARVGYKTYGISKVFHHGTTPFGGDTNADFANCGIVEGSSFRHNCANTGYTVDRNQNPKVHFHDYFFMNTEARDALKSENRFLTKHLQPPYMHVSTDYDAKERARSIIMTHYDTDTRPFLIMLGLRKPHTSYFCEAQGTGIQNISSAYFESPGPLYKETSPAPILYTDTCGAFTNIQQIYEDTNYYMSTNFQGDLRDAIPVDVSSTTQAYTHTVRALRESYMRCVQQVDNHVGELVDLLKTQGLYDNTLIVFTSDHGFHLGEYGRWCKRSPYEGSTKVPLMIKPPGALTPREHVEDVTSGVEIGRIISSYVPGVEPFHTDQIDTSTVLEKSVLTFNTACTTGGINLGCGKNELFNYDYIIVNLRTRAWKYIEVRAFHTRDIDWTPAGLQNSVLFDLEANPEENVDVSAENQPRVDIMRYMLAVQSRMCAPATEPTGCASLSYCEWVLTECIPRAHLYLAHTPAPTRAPTHAPTRTPTRAPTHAPTTRAPTHAPTTRAPTHAPTLEPTRAPTTLAPTPVLDYFFITDDLIVQMFASTLAMCALAIAMRFLARKSY
jgi:arylsulfatase A-like enzyme